jgi:hypothetical protein
MIKKYEDRLKQCEQDHDQWSREYSAWMDDVQHWKDCERGVVAVLYELESALPDHRIQLNQFYDKVMDYKRILGGHKRSISHASTDAIDEKCQAELEDLRKFGTSHCQDCEPQCFEAVMEIHRQAANHHEKMADAHTRLKVEYESAMEQLQQLANRLLTDLDS